MKRPLLFALLVISTACVMAQAPIGGTAAYDFLELSPSARVTGLGGINITTMDHDLSTQLANPATLNPAMHRHVGFGTTIYPGKVNFGNLSYAHKFKVPGTFGFGLQYISYGKFQETDESANSLGLFNANEISVYSGYGYQFGKIFSAGVNAKFVYSQMGPWQSVGMAADLAAMLNDTARQLTFSIVAKNIGGQFTSYTKGGPRSMAPFDLQAGIAFGFKHMPFKFHITLHHLHQWNIRYDDPAASSDNNLFIDSSQSKPKKYIADKIFRHVIVGMEVNIKKIVRLDVAYNHFRQQELRLATKRAIPGLSFGLGLHIRQFDFGYAVQPMAQAGGLHHFTLSVNTAGFVKRKTAPKEEVPQP